MLHIQALREKRNVVAKRMNDNLEKHKGEAWGDDQQKQWDQDLADIDRVDAEIKRIEALMERQAEEAFAAKLGEVGARRAGNGLSAQARSIVAKMLRDGDDTLTSEEWSQLRGAIEKRGPGAGLFARWLRGGDNAVTSEEWTQIRATMSTTTGSEGGFTVTTEVARELIDLLKQFGGMRNVSDVFSTAMGNPMNFPTSDGTAETGELIAENTTATAADPTFGQVALNVFKYSSKIVAVPFELLQDSEIDVEAFVRRRLATRLGRISNTHYTTGTGTGQPRGVAVGAALGKTGTTGQTTTVIYDDLVDLIHSVDPAYRESGMCRFMMHDLSVAKVRKIKDSQGMPIWAPSYADGVRGGVPDRLLGYAVQVNQDVAQMVANAKSILFGDFQYYKIRDVMAVTMFRFTDSAYAKLGQVGFLAWMRSGGNLVDTTAVKHYANSAT